MDWEEAWKESLNRVTESRQDRAQNAQVPVFALTELILAQIRQSAATEKEALAALKTARAIIPLLGL